MDPEEGFDTWFTILSTTISPGGDFSRLLPGFNRLVDQIISNSVLSPPLADRTDTFLDVVVSRIVAAVLNLGGVYPADLKPIQTFLISTSRLVVWAAVRDNFSLVQSTVQVFEKASPFYAKNLTAGSYSRKSEYLRRVMSTFIEAKTAAPLIERMVTGDPVPDHFLLLFELFSKIQTYSKEKYVSCSDVARVLPKFADYLTSLTEETRDLDLSKLWTTIKFSMTFFGVHDVTISPGLSFFAFLFQFAERLLRTDFLPKQIVGGQILAHGRSSSDSVSAYSAFQIWKRASTLGSLLVDRDLHPQLLEILGTVLDQLLTAQDINHFFENAERSHSSQRSMMFDIVSRALRHMDEPAATSLVRRISDREDVAPEMLEFLLATAKSSCNIKPALTSEIADRLIAVGCGGANTKAILDGLASLTYVTSPIAVRLNIISKCSTRLPNVHDQPFVCSMLQKCINGSRDGCEFDQTFENLVINSLGIEGSNTTKLFELLGTLVSKKKQTLEPGFLTKLARPGLGDPLWIFLASVISEMTVPAFPAEIIDGVPAADRGVPDGDGDVAVCQVPQSIRHCGQPQGKDNQVSHLCYDISNQVDAPGSLDLPMAAGPSRIYA
jgi:hypothetical protein